MLSQRFERIFENMTAEEHKEVEFFAAFVIARRSSQKERHILSDDISTTELIKLVSEAGSFDWLNASEEDRHSPEDGAEVQWPQKL